MKCVASIQKLKNVILPVMSWHLWCIDSGQWRESTGENPAFIYYRIKLQWSKL